MDRPHRPSHQASRSSCSAGRCRARQYGKSSRRSFDLSSGRIGDDRRFGACARRASPGSGPAGHRADALWPALLKTGVVIFDELRQGIRELEFLADSRAGELRIGCSEPVAAGILPAIIDRLSQRYPRLDFQLVVGDATTLQVRDLRERKIEVALGQMRSATPEPDMEAEFLFYQRL